MASPLKAAEAVQPEYSLTRAQTGISKVGGYICPVLLLMTDYFSVVAALLTAWYLRGALPAYFSQLPPLDISTNYIYYVIPLLYIAFLTYDGMYVKRLQFWQSTERIFRVCFYATGLLIGLLYFLGKAEYVSRGFILIGWIFSFLYIVTARYGMKKIMVALGLWQKPVVVVGAGKTAEILAKTFVEEPGMGYEIVGLIEDNYRDRNLTRHYPHLGTFSHAEQAIAASGVQDVIIATPGMEREELVDLVYRIQPFVKKLTVVPDLFGLPLSNMEVQTWINERTVLLQINNNLASAWNYYFKRIFDIVVGTAILIAVVPILCLLAILIKMDTSGPVFHIGERLGKGGTIFTCYKFRTMYVNGDDMLQQHLDKCPKAKQEWEKYAKLKNGDPRVTKTGQWLRKFSLDELPQIFNVLKGDMSLVGPRPYLPREQKRMTYFANTIFDTVPGITGLWQVSGRNEIEFEGRLAMDAWYVRNWSFWQDVVILLKTVSVVLGRKGAY